MNYITLLQEQNIRLSDIPEELRTEEICRLAVQQSVWALKHVPEMLKTEEICRLAVKKNGWVLQYVPELLKTKEICRLAVQQHGWVLQHVPELLKTDEICHLAVQQDGWALQHVPEMLKTEEICRLAVKQYGDVIKFVPEEIRDLWNTFISNLSDIPEQLSLSELEDPVTLEAPSKGEIYGLLSVGETWKIGISYTDAKKFIKEKFRNSTKEKIFVPLVNELREVSTLLWVKCLS